MTADEERARLLWWEGCLNARELGGYPTPGGHTAWGAVVRSDNPEDLTEAGRAAVREHGVRTIVDLRTVPEVEQHPNPWAQPGDHGIEYVNIPFVDVVGPEPDFTTLAQGYLTMLDHFSTSVARIMSAIAAAPAGSVLIHCMGGKDRTGLISALLLELVGVPREVVAEDYALTAECLRPWDEEYLEHGAGERAERERLLALYSPTAEVMREVLEGVDRTYGGAEEYLLQAGVTPVEIGRLRGRLLGSQ